MIVATAVEFPLRWRWSNPLPHGAHVFDMAYSSAAGLAVQACERGQVFTSFDLDLWLPRPTGLTNELRAAGFLGQRMIITGEAGTVLYSDDGEHFHIGTLLDGPTGDWLEAVATSPLLAVAAGDNGAIYTSTNGQAWKRQNSGTNTWFSGAAAGLGNFVVVGQHGVILTSPNGIAWTKRASGTSQALYRVGFGNGRFTAVGHAGVTLSSTNGGLNWFPESPGATNALNHAATGGLDRLLVGASEVRMHDNGVWSNELAKTNGPPAWTYYSTIGLPGFFLIAGRTGLQAEGYQIGNEPYFWLTPFDSIRHWLWDAMYLPGFYLTVGDYGTVMTSGNGVDWTLELVPPAVANTTLLGIGGTTNLLVAVGDSGSVVISPQVLTNIVITNETGVVTQTVGSVGVIWHSIPKPTTVDLQGVAVLSNSLYVITGSKGAVLTSPDGSNWTVRVSSTTNLLTSVTAWPGGLIAVGASGTLISSPDGLSWTRRTMNTTNWLYRVRWLNNALITVGQNGTILTSVDGLSWSNRPSGTAQWLNDVCFVGDTWFAFGVGGTVLTSSNLLNWTSRGIVTRKALYGAATDSKQLIAVGVEGAILRCQVIPELTPVSFLAYAHVGTNGFSPAYNVFLFGGRPDQMFSLHRTTNIVDAAWSAGAELEIFDGSGTLFYVETITGTNLPPIEYYRTRLRP